MVVFDTSLLIDAIRKKKAALNLIASYAGKERIATTAINKYEVLRGVTEKDASLVSQWLDQFVIYDLDDSALKEAVTIYKELASRGKMVSELDVLIAGISAANHETLVTKDRDFSSIQSPKIIVL
jgi:predicted nucleic acid-binding protein